jgi:uncharacterized protein YkwD
MRRRTKNGHSANGLVAQALGLGLAVASLVLMTAAARQSPASNDDGRAAQLIAEVNALRAANGLPAFVTDPILMSVAARQNDWRVSTGATTHTGPDGSSPKERAAAAGYGGGGTIFISENIADGTDLTPAQAVQWWTGDAPHLNTMLGPNYVNVGAGAGESDGIWRYTLMAGYVASGSYQPGAVPTAGAVPSQIPQAVPVIQATPQPDGSVVHTVQVGQTLWTIAAVYGVDLDSLLALNGLSPGAILHEGDRIVVVPSSTPTARPSSSAASSSRPSPTLLTAFTPSPPTPTPSPSSSPTERPPLVAAAGPLRSPGMLLIGLGALLVLAGVLLSLRR